MLVTVFWIVVAGFLQVIR